MSTRQALGVTQRAVAPDLARGAMLLFIALANSHYFLTGAPYFGGFPTIESSADRVVAWIISTFVDGRAFPLFGVLFGYGVAHIVRRQHAASRRAVRRLLWRRATGRVAIGVLHCMLLYAGDILSAYGILLFLGAWTVDWRDRWLLTAAAIFLVLTALPSDGSSATAPDGPDAAMLPLDFTAQLTHRPAVFAFVALLGPIGFACPFLIGLWAGRRRLLEAPERHVPLLRWTAGAGVAAAVLGAQPVALALSGMIDRPSADALSVWGPIHDATGIAGGLGYAALAGLVALRVGPRPGRLLTAVLAVGQRSMTCYLAQSVVWAIVFTPYLLDLSGRLDVAATALLAVATWLATVFLADVLRRAGRRGPFETLIRRLTYGPRTPPPTPLTSTIRSLS